MCFQIRDLLLESGKDMPKLCFGSPECFVELVQEKVENPLEFSTVLKAAFRNRGNDLLKINVSHLYGLNSLPHMCGHSYIVPWLYIFCFKVARSTSTDILSQMKLVLSNAQLSI